MNRHIISHTEFRTDTSTSGIISGYASVFNRDSLPLGWDGFVERVAPGAFTKTIKDGADVRALFNHDANIVLGRTKAGTLSLGEDKTGLRYEVTIDTENSQAVNVWRMIQRGDVDQSSFGFQVVKDIWDFDSEPITRTITEARLFDVSPVTFPAYPDATSEARTDYLNAISSTLNVSANSLPDTAVELRSVIMNLRTVEPPPPPPDEPPQALADGEEHSGTEARQRRIYLMRIREPRSTPTPPDINS